MFSLTPPPSEFDNVEIGSLLVCSPPMLGFTYPSPTPSHSAHASLPDSSLSYQDGMPFPDVHSHHTSNEPLRKGLPNSSLSHQDGMPFPDAHSHHTSNESLFFGGEYSSGASFLPVSSLPEQEVAPFHLFQQSPWLSFPPYASSAAVLGSYEPAPCAASSSSLPPSSAYPALEATLPPDSANVIPPTPQEIAPASFDLGRLSGGAAAQERAPSTFSLSRSPSPMAFPTANSRGMSAAGTTTSTTMRSDSTSSSGSQSLHAYGIPVTDSSSGTSQAAWRCAYPGCTSRATFTRGCDLRKHYNRHSKHLFCRVDSCPQSEAAAVRRSRDGMLTGGFSSKKDRARHEAKHNPGIECEWRGPHGEACGRIFSRMDNMKDHVRRIHQKQERRSLAT